MSAVFCGSPGKLIRGIYNQSQTTNPTSSYCQVNNSDKHACFPDTIRFVPLVGIKSFKDMPNGWRYFILAKALVQDGNDHVDREYVRAFCMSIGIRPKTYHRMLDSAIGLGFVRCVERKDHHWDVILIANKKAYKEIAGIDKERTVWIDPKLIAGNGWRANVWGAYIATFNERLISRKKLEELSGVPEVTQRMYERQAGVKSVSNYAVSNVHANGFDGVFEYGNRACVFKYWDRNTHQHKIGWRLPSYRMFPQAKTNGSHKTLRALSLFNRTEEQFKKSLDTISKNDLPNRELYQFSHVSKNGNNIWVHNVV